MSEEQILVASIDDHEVLRDGIEARFARHAPDLALAVSVGSVAAFLEADVRVDVVLLDMQLPEGSPTPLIPDLVATGARVLLHTTQEVPVPLQRAVAAGAIGLVLKSDPAEALIDAVRRAADGVFVCSGPLAHALLHDESRVARLSPRQVEILRGLDEGLTYRQVAAQVDCSESALKTHLARIRDRFRQIGIEPGNTHHLARIAADQGHLRD
jgi:DNA-binding NarL/FixJ family response regulator